MKLNVTDEHKKHMSNLLIEIRVLEQLTRERKAMMEKKAIDILTTNGLSPKLYSMHFNPSEDKWEAMLKPGVLTVPAPGTDISKIKSN